MAKKTLPTRPTKKEKKWVDFDEDNQSWGVFGVDSGFCYNLCGSKGQAEKIVDDEEIAEIDAKNEAFNRDIEAARSR